MNESKEEIESIDMSHCIVCGEYSTDRKRMIIETTVCTKCYPKVKDSDIEFLRKKLIEDIRKLWEDASVEKNFHVKYVEQIINKRFGVDEDEG